ncbi:hypothetical protein [Algicella marina]|uniref:Uncharacterized protein n=1 Tax=Algicella marina TaxID=2683284 RepID=A0A6P1SZ66_9RHOB|nr:hypothetical protein [Algicella marina]QHQ34761.1 hypothetical protein GO499_05910 [Algicella marina]
MYQSRFDKFIGMLERSAHALRMGLVLAGVTVGSAALFLAFNGPKPERAQAMATRMAEEGRIAVKAFAPEGWSVVCLGDPGQDVRELIRAETGQRANACSGFNQSFFFYDGFAAIGFADPLGCDIIPVPVELFSPSGGKPRCVENDGLMMMSLKDRAADSPVLVVERR